MSKQRGMINRDAQSPHFETNWPKWAEAAVEVVFIDQSGDEQEVVLSPVYFQSTENAVLKYAEAAIQCRTNVQRVAAVGEKLHYKVRLYRKNLQTEEREFF